MIDKEKIEKGLRCCIEGDHCNSTDCPYYDAAPNIQGCTQALCQDVLALLKEQEAVEPKQDYELNELNMMFNVYYCGNCGEKITGKGKFCSSCGRPVKYRWDA